MHNSLAAYVAEQQNLVKRCAEQFSVASITEKYFSASNPCRAGTLVADMIATQSARDALEEQFASIAKGIAWPDSSFSELIRRQQEQFQGTLSSSSALAQTIAAGLGPQSGDSLFAEMQRLDVISATQSVASMVDAQEAQWRRTMESNLYGISQVADSLATFVNAARNAADVGTVDYVFGNAAKLQDHLLQTFGALGRFPNVDSAALDAANAFYRLTSTASERDIFAAAREAAECYLRGEEVSGEITALDPAEDAQLHFTKLFLTILQVWLFGDTLSDATREKKIALVLFAMLEFAGVPNPRAALHEFFFADHNKATVEYVVQESAQTEECRPSLGLVHTSGGNAKLRAQPGTRTQVVRFLPDRTSVVVEPASEVRAGSKIWVRVRAQVGPDDFAQGWIARDLLDVFAIDGVRCVSTEISLSSRARRTPSAADPPSSSDDPPADPGS
jgi:hypothetical protein